MKIRRIVNEECRIRTIHRDRKTIIRCGENWIYITPVGDNFYVTATGFKAQTVPASDVYSYVRELALQLE